MSTIYVSKGMKRHVGGTIIETNGKDITSATFQIALGTDNEVPPDPSSWVAPSVNVQGAAVSQRTVLLLVDSSTPLGTYFVWGRVADNPEIEPPLLDGPIVVA